MPPLRSSLVLGASVAMLATSGCAMRRAEPEPSPATLPRGGPEWAAPGPEISPEQGGILPHLVRRGWLELTVPKPAETAQAAQQVAQRLGGLTANARVSETRADLVLRVPEPRLNEAIDSLSMLGRMDSRRLSSDDVSQEVIDLEARLASLMGVRDRLRALLERSSSMSEIMSIEREMVRVQTEIDAIEGRLRHLRSRATMAELSLSVRRERILGPLGYVIAGIGWTLGKLFVVQ